MTQNREYPIQIIWPAGLNVACIGGQWQRLEDGSILATYNNRDELAWSIHVTRWVNEDLPAAGVFTDREQLAMFAGKQAHNYHQED